MPRGVTTTMSRKLVLSSAALTAALVLASASETVVAQARRVPDTFTATTTDMTPAGVTLRFDVLEWSDDDARAAVISTLTSEPLDRKSLAQLPTVGYVWPRESSVGYSLKYAHRTRTADDRERLTFVTDKPVGSYDFQPWAVDGESPQSAADYSVIVLYVDDEGNGHGTMSLAAEVVFDHDSHTVSLDEAGTTANVLAGARREPKPYWAQES
jgi:hypothetical protein